MRAFVIEHEFEESELKSEIRRDMIQKLAAEWNTIHHQIESQSWRSEEESYQEADHLAELAEDASFRELNKALKCNPNLTESEQYEIRQKAEDAFYQNRKDKQGEIYLRQEVIEELLSHLGARMARPYEHWNEEEMYVEYMENRFDLDREFY